MAFSTGINNFSLKEQTANFFGFANQSLLQLLKSALAALMQSHTREYVWLCSNQTSVRDIDI